MSLQADEELYSGRGLLLLVLGQGRLSEAKDSSEPRLCQVESTDFPYPTTHIFEIDFCGRRYARPAAIFIIVPIF
jgi:hypothetical protein